MRQSLIPQLLMVSALLLLSGCGVNNLPTLDEGVKAAWSQVQNQYQRRADLIPNLVATVKGYAAQERETLLAVTEWLKAASCTNGLANALARGVWPRAASRATIASQSNF